MVLLEMTCLNYIAFDYFQALFQRAVFLILHRTFLEVWPNLIRSQNKTFGQPAALENLPDFLLKQAGKLFTVSYARGTVMTIMSVYCTFRSILSNWEVWKIHWL